MLRLAPLPLLVTSFAVAGFALNAHASDWPQWRGPNRDGISTETGLLKQWPAGGPKLGWKAMGLGGGYSGVSVAAGRVYTMGDGADTSHVHALDEKTGRLLWSTKVGATGGEDRNRYPGTRCTPTVDGKLIYATGQWGDLVCLEGETGREVWRRSMKTDFKGKMMSSWGYAESPLIDGDHVIVCPGGRDGTMAALDKKTGAVVWRSKEWTDNAGYSSIVPATIGGVRQYVQLTDANVAGVDPASGKVLWKAPRAGRTAVIPTPVVDGNFVYVTSGYGVGCNLFRVTANGGKFSAEQVYANKEIKNHHGGVVKVGANVVGFSDGDGWVWQDLPSGKTAFKAEQKKLGKGSITMADGMLYLRHEAGGGTVVLLDGSKPGWVEKGRFDQPNRSNKNSWPHPVIANGRLYLRDQDVLLAYDVRKS
ncbi:MAG: PQQ-like beta-propeller repeat protein [Opitutaceae bacterium]|nr:PQQ-like beta-propeller repeat protein [Opitutaceae bacterium]